MIIYLFICVQHLANGLAFLSNMISHVASRNIELNLQFIKLVSIRNGIIKQENASNPEIHAYHCQFLL